MRRRLLVALKPLDGIPVENRVGPGTPDVNFIGGWAELKWLRAWPRKGGAVHLPHYTKGQRLWMRRRALRGGLVLLVLQVQKQWLFFNWEYAYEHVGIDATKIDMEENAIRHFRTGLDNKGLVSWLKSLS